MQTVDLKSDMFKADTACLTVSEFRSSDKRIYIKAAKTGMSGETPMIELSEIIPETNPWKRCFIM